MPLTAPARLFDLLEKTVARVGAARLNLSALYARGTGVGKDPVRALMWRDLAVAGGLDVDGDVRDHLTVGMSPGQIEDAGRRARERLEQ